MKNKVLAIDIGNTTIGYGLFQKDHLLTSGYVKNGNIPGLLRNLKRSGVKSLDKLVISSVVPKKSKILKKAFTQAYKEIFILEVGRNLPIAVKMKYRKDQLGADRLINIYGAVKRIKLPALIIDFGTAITFDFIDKNGVFRGGLIVPGLETSWRALQEKAALLPKHLKLKAVKELAATNTESAMFSGLLNGFGAMTDGLIGRFKRKYGKGVKVLATGGASPLISKYCYLIDVTDPLHTLKSLQLAVSVY